MREASLTGSTGAVPARSPLEVVASAPLGAGSVESSQARLRREGAGQPVAATIEVSLRRLTPNDQVRYREMLVFGEDVAMPGEVVARRHPPIRGRGWDDPGGTPWQPHALSSSASRCSAWPSAPPLKPSASRPSPLALIVPVFYASDESRKCGGGAVESAAASAPAPRPLPWEPPPPSPPPPPK
jgi:hypothetical protein